MSPEKLLVVAMPPTLTVVATPATLSVPVSVVLSRLNVPDVVVVRSPPFTAISPSRVMLVFNVAIVPVTAVRLPDIDPTRAMMMPL
jgi:hypothetical protein